MRTLRKSIFALIGFAAAAMASAQFDGPAPVAWRYQALNSAAPGSPLVVGNVVYTTNAGRLYALDLESGNRKWQYPAVEALDGRFKASPILVGDKVVVAADNGIVYAVDAKGQTAWSYHSNGQVVGQMISVGDYIVFRVESNQLMAIKAADGQPAWDVPYTNISGIRGGIAALGTDVLFYNDRQQLVSINSVTRANNWVVTLQNIAINTAPVVAGDTIYLNCANAIVALNALSHTLKWQKLTQDRLMYNLAVTQDGVYGTTDNGAVMGWDLGGTPLSRQAIPLGTQVEASPTASGKIVAIATTNGAVTLVDFNSGKVVWSYLIHPTADYIKALGAGSTGIGRGRGRNGGGGGAQGDPGGAGFGGPGGAAQTTEAPVTISASAPPIISGTSLLVPVLDGSLIAFDKKLGVDLTAPSVKMTFPNPGDQVSPVAPLQLWFKIEDEASGVNASTLNIDIDGTKMDTKLERDGSAIVKFSLTGKNRILTDGRKTITVTVADWLGNVRKQSFSLTIDSSLRAVKLPGTTTNQNTRGPGAGSFGPGGGDGPGKG